MYNKLFSRIVTSSIWDQPHHVRIVWITLLAMMDQDGIAHLATPRTVGSLARVEDHEAIEAITILESPDQYSSNSDHDGRRIQRVPGGWLVLNASTYRQIATRAQDRARTAERMRRSRSRLRISDGSVTRSDTDTDTDTDTKRSRSSRRDDPSPTFDQFWLAYPRKVAKAAARKAWRGLEPSPPIEALLAALDVHVRSEGWTRDEGRFIPHAATWLRGRRWEDDLAPVAAQDDYAARAARAEMAIKARQRLLGTRSGEGV